MTTDEMDGLFSDQDIKDKYKLKVLCSICNEYKTIDVSNLEHKTVLSYREKCIDCGRFSWVISTARSIRTYNDSIDKKVRKSNSKKVHRLWDNTIID